MDPLTNPAFLLFAAVSPLLISIAKQSGWSRQVNALVALACYIIVGVVAAVLSGEPLTLENALELVTIATVVGTAAYHLVWDNLGARDDLALSLDDRLTDLTSVFRR